MKCRLSISKETQNIMTFLREIACAPYMFQPLNHLRIQKYDDTNTYVRPSVHHARPLVVKQVTSVFHVLTFGPKCHLLNRLVHPTGLNASCLSPPSREENPFSLRLDTTENGNTVARSPDAFCMQQMRFSRRDDGRRPLNT